MLEILRRGASSWVAKILFVLLIVSFGAWGIGDFLKPDPNRPVATVGDTKITPTQFQETYRQEFERLSQRFGGRLTREFAGQLGLPQQVLRQMITRRLVEIEAERLGISIGDDQVRAAIYANPAFRGAGGQFDQARFVQVLQANGLSEAAYVAILRDELGMDQLAGSVIAAATPPASIAGTLYAFREEERTATLALVANSSVTGIPDPTDEELATFHDEHKDIFMAPEYRAMTVLLLQPDEIMAGIKPAEADIKAAYDARAGEFRTPATRKVVQLLFSDENAAREAQKELAGGKPIDAVAEAAKAKGGQRTDLGEVKQGELFPKQVEDAAFALAAPGVTEAIKSPLGWHVLVVSDIKPASQKPLAEVHDQIAHDVAREAAIDKIRSQANQIEDELAGGATLEEAAQKLGVTPLKIAATDHNGTDPSGTGIPELANRPYVLAAAFDAPEGQDTPLADTPDSGMFSVRVDKITPAAVKPLDQIRPDVAQAWRAERMQAKAKELADGYAERVRKGEPLAKVAEAAKLPTRTTQPFKRTANQPADWLPGSVVAKLFDVGKGEVAVAPTAEGQVVGVVESINRPDPAKAADAVQQVRDRLGTAMAGDFEAQFTKALEERIGVTIDQSMLQRVL